MTGALPWQDSGSGDRPEAGNRDELPFTVGLPLVVGFQRASFVFGRNAHNAATPKSLSASRAWARLSGSTPLPLSRCLSRTCASSGKTSASIAPVLSAESTTSTSGRLIETSRIRRNRLTEVSLSCARLATTATLLTETGSAPETTCVRRSCLAEVCLSTSGCTKPLLLPEPGGSLDVASCSPTPAIPRLALPRACGTENLRRSPLKEGRISTRLQQCRTVYRAVRVNGKQPEAFPGNWIYVGTPKISNSVCVDQSVNAGWEDAKLSLVFLNCPYVLLSTKYQLFFQFPLRLDLIDGQGGCKNDRQRGHEDNQCGECEPGI